MNEKIVKTVAAILILTAVFLICSVDAVSRATVGQPSLDRIAVAGHTEFAEKSDHDLQIEMNTMLRRLIQDFENHLQHHWMITLLAISAGLVGIFNFSIGLILILVPKVRLVTSNK